MLRSYLTSIPYTNFILIEDTLEERGKPIFDFLLKVHLDRSKNRVHYFVFQENFVRVKSKLIHNNIVLYDYVSNVSSWNKEPKCENFEDTVKNVGVNSVIFIDSLAHLVYEFGLAETYRLLSTLKLEADIQQIVVLLHGDLLEEKLRVEQLFQHLCTLRMAMLPKFNPDYGRVQYTYKKMGGKIIKAMEEYWIENENLQTRKIEKPDPKVLEKVAEINPETLSTFKIGLSEEEKLVRDTRRGEILPYLPQQDDQNEQTSRVFYQFDEVDDWDEEDPDDDLDI